MENVYQENEIEIKDGPKIVWIRVQDAAKLLWSENPKLHSIGDLVQSIEKHGFQELPRYDINLPNASGDAGAIKAGNGRIETLAAMERDGMSLPRGLAQDKLTQAWVMPILVGTDADSLNAARAYAIDSNNLTMSGGDFTLGDILKLWSKDTYIALLKDLTPNDMPISVALEDLDWLLGLDTYGQSPEMTDEEASRESSLAYKVNVSNLLCFEDVGKALGDLSNDHPEWKLDIELLT